MARVSLRPSGRESRAGPAALWLLGILFGPPVAAQGPPSRPDLIVDSNRLSGSWQLGYRFFHPGDCALAEGCVLAPGWRRLLVFSTQTANISQDSLELGDPTIEPGFQFDTCHGHYHFEGWAKYELLDAAGQVAAPGHKQAFCVVETDQYLFEPWVGPATHDCDLQGLNAGWSDIYGSGLDCQWVDVTEVPGGTYELTVTVNPDGIVRESDSRNNTGSHTLSVPDPGILPDLILDAAVTQSTLGVQLVDIAPGSLAVLDGCVGGTGPRRLLTFTTKAINLSQGDLYLGHPSDNPLYTFVPAHNHYHTPGVASFEIVEPGDGFVVATASPSSWLLADGTPWVQAPWVKSRSWYDVNLSGGLGSVINSGLQRGWESGTIPGGHCQWVDVTSIPDGDYILRLTINPMGHFAESNVSNNAVQIPFTLIAPPTPVSNRPDGYLVPGTPLTAVQRRMPGDPPMLVTEITYDVTSCPAPRYNLYYSANLPGSYSYTGAVCDLGSQGIASVELPEPAPGELIWFLVAGQNGNAGGGHGFNYAGQLRPMTGLGFCGVLQQVVSATCP